MLKLSLEGFPPAPIGKTGFPWTEEVCIPYNSENLPKISIVTPSFNQGQYIEETIRSVILQNYPNLEYIIIDGGSTDETVNIIKKYERWLSFWISEPDSGQSEAINKGLCYASGDIFNWLNSDDIYLPNVFWAISRYFSENKDLNVLCAREYLMYENGKKLLTNGTILCSTLEETIAVGRIQQPPTFFRLSIVNKLGGVDNKLHFCMDTELWVSYLTYFGLTGIKKIDLVVNIFRMHNSAKTANLRSVYFQERFYILISLIRSLRSLMLSKRLIEDSNTFKDACFYKQYELASIIDETALAIYSIERLFTYGIQFLPWRIILYMYFYVLQTKFWGWHWKFYAAPLIKIKRWFQPL